MRLIAISIVTLLVSGCSTEGFSPTNTLGPEEEHVVSRIDELDKRPEWLKESEPFVVDSDRVVALGGTEIPGDHRIDAAYRIAENNAEAALAGVIGRKLEFLFQNAEEGTGLDERQVRFIGASATRLITSSMRPGRRYWEKIAFASDAGKRMIKYRVFATVEMPQDELKRAVLEEIRKASGKGDISPDFAEKVDRQWEQFMAPSAP